MITPAADSAASALLLPGFEYRRIDVEDVTISCAVDGAGPPLLLLHGYPQNHLTWRHVAPTLAEDHTVVLVDLRGYGGSGKPAPDTAGLVYSKRSMARDQVSLMRQLGFGQFQLASHDRGARVAHRLVLDHPGAVTRLAVLGYRADPARPSQREPDRGPCELPLVLPRRRERHPRAHDRCRPRLLGPCPDWPASWRRSENRA